MALFVLCSFAQHLIHFGLQVCLPLCGLHQMLHQAARKELQRILGHQTLAAVVKQPPHSTEMEQIQRAGGK